jgi:hypothetical protein
MADEPRHPRDADEWRVEVHLHHDALGLSFGERLRSLRLDDEARERLGGSVLVTRDGPRLFLYARHKGFALEAEAVVRELIEAEGLAAEVAVTRWHPLEDAWRPAEEPLPRTAEERAAERRRHLESEAEHAAETGHDPWEVVVETPHLGTTLEFARELEARDLPVKRRWKYVLVGALTEEDAIELGERLEKESPEGSHVGIRPHLEGVTRPSFVFLSSLKPDAARDLGL